MGTFYDAPNDYRNYLAHHGVKGMKWGHRKQYIAHPRIGRAASPNTLMTKLISSGYERKINRRKAKNHDLVAKKNESGKKQAEYYRQSVDKFHSDKKFKNKVIDYIAKSGRQDSEYWAKTLKAPDAKDRYPENVNDAVEMYLYNNDMEYRNLRDNATNSFREYNDVIYKNKRRLMS